MSFDWAGDHNKFRIGQEMRQNQIKAIMEMGIVKKVKIDDIVFKVESVL